MKIFLSYGHDSNTPIIEKKKSYILNDVERNYKYEVRIDMCKLSDSES